MQGVVSVGGPAPKVLTGGNLGDEGAGCRQQGTVPAPPMCLASFHLTVAATTLLHRQMSLSVSLGMG